MASLLRKSALTELDRPAYQEGECAVVVIDGTAILKCCLSVAKDGSKDIDATGNEQALSTRLRLGQGLSKFGYINPNPESHHSLRARKSKQPALMPRPTDDARSLGLVSYPDVYRHLCASLSLILTSPGIAETSCRLQNALHSTESLTAAAAR